MRLQNAVLVAAAVLATSADSLEVASNSAPIAALRGNTRYPPHVDGMDTRLLVSEAADDSKTPSNYEFTALEEDEYDDGDDEEEETKDNDEDEERKSKKKKKKSKKKKKKKKSSSSSGSTDVEVPEPTEKPTIKDRIRNWWRNIIKD
ncbi:hypothetical protein PHYBOEH_004162 [Phytophthora boehmeriae]|uniref:RxLR effector protein n=1 Tax=Phytophthora boehmeriae TaxID=109152 RepID=A0A8T1WPR0_9STRA|nr:hypothetical protein PHYBOEH_004162 [Phytophthora boehmeriae]